MASPLALTPPETPLTPVSQKMVETAVAASRQSPRGRIILPLQKSPKDPLHRMFNAMQPGSYVRPHRHDLVPKPECAILLRGSIGYIQFDEQGKVLQTIVAQAGGPIFGIDATPDVWHTFFALEPDTLVFECKPGPYSADTDKRFAPWAPAENTPEAAGLMAQWVALFDGTDGDL